MFQIFSEISQFLERFRKRVEVNQEAIIVFMDYSSLLLSPDSYRDCLRRFVQGYVILIIKIHLATTNHSLNSNSYDR